VLFDEIEKAHPEVFNVLLQVLDDGRLTDSQGRTVDFRNTVIIMTSNIGSQYILDVAGLDEEVERRVMQAMRQHFRPEFLNRVDEMVIFHSLTMEHLVGIVEIQLERLRARLQEREITISLTDAAKQLIVEAGYDPAYGARPLKRAIQHKIADPLALEILEGRVRDGDHVQIGIRDEQLSFSVVEDVADGAGVADAADVESRAISEV
jgi:ATP-dependent Clp protease ATP-binding subunit ClpB